MTSSPDLVIRGGNIADGLGGELFEADVAIKDGRISEVGRVCGKGNEEIDAKGMLVTPGFVDVHTHYDGQVTWASELSPSSWHGVTTVVFGNCGVGFAPCRPNERELLIKVMEGVEDIPEPVLAQGLEWDWETFRTPVLVHAGAAHAQRRTLARPVGPDRAGQRRRSRRQRADHLPADRDLARARSVVHPILVLPELCRDRRPRARGEGADAAA